MSQASRKLQIGDRVTTDFNRRFRGLSEHVIVERKQPSGTGSDIAFKVDPVVWHSGGGWMDADWFEPVHQEGSESNG